ncbi:MAG: hypothetical protein ACKOKC_03090 [Chthoniobacterales bacterium]
MASPLEFDSHEAECLEWVKRGEWDWRSAHLLFEAEDALAMMDQAWPRLAALLPSESRVLGQSLRRS